MQFDPTLQPPSHFPVATFSSGAPATENAHASADALVSKPPNSTPHKQLPGLSRP